ncbi:alkaline phosphatase family protein [Cupriavidus basilensis]
MPEVWSKTVLLVNFDENDGYFDHVPSPSAPSLNADNVAGREVDVERCRDELPSTSAIRAPAGQQGPAGGGWPRLWSGSARCRCFAISPWSRGGWVNSRKCSITRRCCAFWRRALASRSRTSARSRRAGRGDLTERVQFQDTERLKPCPRLRAAARATRRTSCARRSSVAGRAVAD